MENSFYRELGAGRAWAQGAGSWELATGQGDECCAALAPAVAARAPLGNCTIWEPGVWGTRWQRTRPQPQSKLIKFRKKVYNISNGNGDGDGAVCGWGCAVWHGFWWVHLATVTGRCQWSGLFTFELDVDVEMGSKVKWLEGKQSYEQNGDGSNEARKVI